MRALVTGVGGFIGSHLAEELCRLGWQVLGVDCRTPYYDVAQKDRNLAEVRRAPGLTFRDVDLRTADLDALLDGIDVVFHQAGQPGVRDSWGTFTSYVEHNVHVTYRLLEAASRRPLHRFVYASSSSVYGNAVRYPTTEDMPPAPQSPYGVTKLAAEHLCGVYGRAFEVPTVSLRYFTVFGPRQRPDMAMHRLIEAALTGEPFPLFGTGRQVRDFTYVDDVVAANITAALCDVVPGSVFNVAGGSGTITLAEVIDLVQRLVGGHVRLDRQPEQAGDVVRTGGDVTRAREVLGWRPRVSVEDGLRRQVAWHTARRDTPARERTPVSSSIG